MPPLCSCCFCGRHRAIRAAQKTFSHHLWFSSSFLSYVRPCSERVQQKRRHIKTLFLKKPINFLFFPAFLVTLSAHWAEAMWSNFNKNPCSKFSNCSSMSKSPYSPFFCRNVEKCLRNSSV